MQPLLHAGGVLHPPLCRPSEQTTKAACHKLYMAGTALCFHHGCQQMRFMRACARSTTCTG